MTFSFQSIRKDARPLMMGILNLTPDSFSDGGKFMYTRDAVKHGIEMAENGADIVDIGGQSTRPGSLEVPTKIELDRILPTLKALRLELPNQVISVDTSKPEVAQAVLSEGVDLINDITGGRDTKILELVKEFKAGLVLMHMQGEPATMQNDPKYQNVVKQVKNYLENLVSSALAQGIAEQSIAIDPGIGFGKKKKQNIAILNGLNSFVETGYPVLLGTSRKTILREICKNSEIQGLQGATCATTALGVLSGVKIFRVHDVIANRQAADVMWELMQET